ncbi:hypothetical protein RMB12_14455 [Acinetobacter sp. V117_2]|uniref:hypothetical protein n=1 Tax=Acinetobacter sp. V117_2 TaxID=3072989 RepID=UPI00287C5C33|nr:hypothetical protein [Acinetobacter sp. V117_2]MDS7968222.1 hypothetical protein [Acinetobacter sp. V117_2]
MAIPDKGSFIDPSVTEQQFKLNLGIIVDFLKYVESLSPTYATTALLKASRPEQSLSFAKALDTGKVWLWNKPVGSPNGNYWFETELSDLDQANKFSVSASNVESKHQFRNFSFFSSNTIPWLYPIVGEQANKVLLGFNNKTNQIFGNGILDPKLMHSLRLYLGANQYPLVLDALHKMILGYDAAKDSLVGLFPEPVGTPKDEPLPFELPKKMVNMILAYGQSLTTGVGQNIVLSTSQPFFNITYASGVRGNNGDFTGLKPLVEDAVKPTPDGEIRSGETICSGAANYATLAAYKENGVRPEDHIIFASTAGHGGYTIQQLSKGSEWYNSQFINHVTGAKNLNPDLALHVINWAQGEASADSTQPVHYSALIQFHSDAEADIKAITGQTSPVLMFTYQHSTFIYKRPAVALALLQACQTSDKFYFIAPTYAFPPAFDNIHLSEVGYKWLGAYYGRAYKQAVHDKIKPRAIMPRSATIKGNVVKVKFNVPHTPLVLDKVNLAETFQHGFAVFDGATEILTSDIYIENGDTVVLVLSSVPSSSSVTVNYAIDYLSTSLALFKGASGNLRDSCTDTCVVAGTTKHMHYICPHFSIQTLSEII